MDTLSIRTHRGPCDVRFGGPFAGLEDGLGTHEHLLVDERVAALYAGLLGRCLESPRVVRIPAREESKSLEGLPPIIERLLANGCQRGHELIAIGGGIVQDITAFVAATLFRGLSWRFHPTTLLAQADSCIGSKSSMNLLGHKNVLGTFTPPHCVHVATEVLATLDPIDLRSGIGEMLKVHYIAGDAEFARISRDYERLLGDRTVLEETIRRSLGIKQVFIEKDEFDRAERLVLNYGHSFGHAIEAATRFAVPHGIAVTLGMDLANYISWRRDLLGEKPFREAHAVLIRNAAGFESTTVPFEAFMTALARDKKNMGSELSLVLTRGPGDVFLHRVPNDSRLREACLRYLTEIRAAC